MLKIVMILSIKLILTSLWKLVEKWKNLSFEQEMNLQLSNLNKKNKHWSFYQKETKSVKQSWQENEKIKFFKNIFVTNMMKKSWVILRNLAKFSHIIYRITVFLS